MKNNRMTDSYSDQEWGFLPEGLQESIDQDDYVIGVYYAAFSSTLDPWYMGKIIVKEQTIGSYVPVTSDVKEILRRFSAKIIGVYEVPPAEISIPREQQERQYIIQIAYPLEGLENQLPLLLTTLMGNVSLGGKVKLLDIKFSKRYLNQFQGPKFGIDGLRKSLGVEKRPLLANINHAYSIEDGKALFKEASLGGADLIKDDESMAGNIHYLPLDQRVVTYMELVDKAKEETGEDTIYLVNVTDEPDKIMQNAQSAIDHGANGLMVNYLTVGLPVVRVLTNDPSLNVPVIGHMDFAGVFYESNMSGISSFLIMGKMARLAGLDILVYPSTYGKAPFLRDKYFSCAKALRYPFGPIKTVFPMPAGGVTPSITLKMIKDLGLDIVIGAGVGIHSHPQGTRSGTIAFRQVIDISVNDLEEASEDLEDYLDDNEGKFPELQSAIESWGQSSIKYLDT
ncbi:MAG: RuBisCO large subunit C-terminal-like domain-containing protein [Candidatus Hodarchaeales archaeon]|jgi:2,3-diketo-5-methylthiopentyl-1-phosphate enolase